MQPLTKRQQVLQTIIKISVVVIVILLFIFQYSGKEAPASIIGTSNEDCKFDDGEHYASIDYYNPETGHRATYDLSVEVEDCEVTQINFNNGGWLDDSHISPTEIDEDGEASVTDDRGREFEIHIDH